MYSFLYYLLLPIIIIHTFFKHKGSAGQKLGFIPKSNIKNPIHIHCVSVGEFNAVKVLVDNLLKNNEKVLITNTTNTGFSACEKYYGNKVYHCYFPFDISFAIKRFLRVFQPKISIMVETEIWPNYAKICHKKNINLGIINARLSEKSFNKYYKYQNFSKKVLGCFDFIATQNQQTSDYFTKLGGKNLITLPSLKFEMDINLNKNTIDKIKNITGNREFLICGSTHHNEEEQIIKAYLKNPIQELLVIMPRHPQRFNEVEKMLIYYKINYAKQSDLKSNIKSNNFEVLLADSMGELLEYYLLASIAFVGGSLAVIGGHNVLEPIYFNKLTLCGTGAFNFRDIIIGLNQNNGIINIENADEIMSISHDYFQNNDKYQDTITNAKKYLNANIGASDEILKIIFQDDI